jgi:hypothetical protein
MRLWSSRSRNPILYGWAVLSIGLFGFSNVASAQQAAGITGQVKDESGGLLPGVTVTATSPALQVSSVTDVTNAQGEYRLTPLPIGTYILEFVLPGFQTNRRTDFRLETGVQARADVVLNVGAIEETVTVSGAAPIVDVAATASSTQFTRETLALTPTSRNGLISLGAQAPGVRGLTDVGGGTVGLPVEFQTFGQKTESSNIIEGVHTTVNQYGGGNGGNYFDYDTFEEVKVQSLSNGPEIASHGAAFTEIVKSGGNTFHGTLQHGHMNSALESSNIDETLRAQGINEGNAVKIRTDQGGDLGGRIVRDKLWFYGSFRFRQESRADFGGTMPDGSPAFGVDHETLYSQKISYQATQSNRFVFYNFGGSKYVYAQTVSQFVPWESRNWRYLPFRIAKGEWQATWGNSVVMSVQAAYWWWATRNPDVVVTKSKELEAAGVPRGFDVRFIDDLSDFANWRPAFSDQATQKIGGTFAGGPGAGDTGKYDHKFTLSWYRPDLFLGNHEFRMGVGYEPFWKYNMNGNRGKAGDYRLIFNNGVPTQIDLYNTPIVTHPFINYSNGYVNDTWTIARRLTLNLGARYSSDAGGFPAQCRLAGVYPFAPAACVDASNIHVNTSVAPRLYFSYDIMGDSNSVLKGGWGRFDRQRALGEFNFISPLANTTRTFRWRDLNGNRDYDPGEVNLDLNGPDFIAPGAAVGNFATPGAGADNPNEKRGGTHQFSLTFERQLARNLGMRITGVYIRTFDELRYLNTLRPPSSYTNAITNRDPGADGVLGNADDPGTFITYYEYPTALAGGNNEFFIISNDPAGSETHKAIDVQLSKRLANRWQFLASYTATKNDVPLPRYDDGFFISSNNSARGISNWTPNAAINTSNHTWDRQGKLSGLYILAGGVSVSANYSYMSGLPQARQVLFRGGVTIPSIVLNVEPIGSIRTPSLSAFDLRLDKAFSFGSKGRLAVRMNLYNVLNANTVTARNLRSGPTYLLPTAILPPRIVELGAIYSF